ncbi:MAG: OFA family MFS transporter [Phascolarctobacterium sp.]|uniref:L-lactate MFS transporter n=1 Tax=Phascolarctobacterium sp. TaxID=2049039 RepID=UPI0026DC5E03|nr:OFA family MFS transporter [Phascolarctobacterium sp.]MDO4920519.1 OFA family MFS transporter [Phascolarctobacterium sp.]
MQQTKNKWLIVLAAIGIHISIGSVYAWSVLTRPIMQAMGFILQQVTWTFSLAILFLGLSAGFLGTYVERYGPRRSGLTAAAFFGVGMLGTAYALSRHSLPLLYLSYGVIGGIGLGVGYITPVSTLVKWFPQNRGLATGLAIMGFGFASLIAGPVMQLLIAKYGLIENFIILGCAYVVVMTASALYLEPPKMPELTSKGNFKVQLPEQQGQFSVQEAMRTWQFYALWWVFFTNITCGIGLLAVASPMAQEVIKMSPMEAASMVGVIGLLNGGGRIVWSTISDYLGRRNTYIAFFAIEIVAFYLLAGVTDSLFFQLLIFIIITCYGGGFSCMPAYLSDLYGTKQLSAIHGRILTAWGLAGIVGPLLLSQIYERTHSYSVTLYFFSACFVVSLAVAVVLKFKADVRKA